MVNKQSSLKNGAHVNNCGQKLRKIVLCRKMGEKWAPVKEMYNLEARILQTKFLNQKLINKKWTPGQKISEIRVKNYKLENG